LAIHHTKKNRTYLLFATDPNTRHTSTHASRYEHNIVTKRTYNGNQQNDLLLTTQKFRIHSTRCSFQNALANASQNQENILVSEYHVNRCQAREVTDPYGTRAPQSQIEKASICFFEKMFLPATKAGKPLQNNALLRPALQITPNTIVPPSLKRSQREDWRNDRHKEPGQVD
jgi:hypothetical protein